MIGKLADTGYSLKRTYPLGPVARNLDRSSHFENGVGALTQEEQAGRNDALFRQAPSYCINAEGANIKSPSTVQRVQLAL